MGTADWALARTLAAQGGTGSLPVALTEAQALELRQRGRRTQLIEDVVVPLGFCLHRDKQNSWFGPDFPGSLPLLLPHPSG